MLKGLLALVVVLWWVPLLYVTVRKHPVLEEPLMALGWFIFAAGLLILGKEAVRRLRH